MATTSTGKPTSRQLAYLKSLADRTGQTFTYPKTSRQASQEINRLKHAKPSSGQHVVPWTPAWASWTSETTSAGVNSPS